MERGINEGVAATLAETDGDLFQELKFPTYTLQTLGKPNGLRIKHQVEGTPIRQPINIHCSNMSPVCHPWAHTEKLTVGKTNKQKTTSY